MKRTALPAALLLLAACAVPVAPPVPAGLEGLDRPVRDQYETRRDTLEADRGDGESWGELGLWFDAYEQWDAAATCYARAHGLSEETRWLEQLAHAERLRGQPDAAAAVFAQVLESQPDAVPARVWLGELKLSGGDHSSAASLFSEALELIPGHARARAGLARVAHREGHAARAVALLELSLEDQPESGVLHHLLGLALRDSGDETRAAEHLAIAAAQGASLKPIAMDDPRRAEVAALRASGRAEARRAGAALREGRFDDALSRLEDALAANPADATAALNLARAQARLGEPEAAIATLGPLLEREPGHSRGLEVRALAHSLAGDEAAALSDFRAAVAADSGNTGAQRQLGRLLWSRNEKAASLPHWKTVAELEPTDAQARYRRAEAATHQGRWADAITWLERDVEELPQPAAFRQLLTRTLSIAPPPLRDGDRALELALAEHARVPRLRQAETVAIAHAGRGDYVAARVWQAAALRTVEDAGRLKRHPWVASRLALLQTGTRETHPFRAGERRGSLPVSAP